MDQRGFSTEPSETALPLPAARVAAWAALAARGRTIEYVPAQREDVAA